MGKSLRRKLERSNEYKFIIHFVSSSQTITIVVNSIKRREEVNEQFCNKEKFIDFGFVIINKDDISYIEKK